MTSEEYVPVKQAAVLAGVSVRTLHYWIETGKLPYLLPTKRKRGKVVRLADVLDLSQTSATDVQVGSATATDDVQLHEGSASEEGDVDHPPAIRSGSGSLALIAHLEQLYQGQLAAKDEVIAAKDETIEELRRRAEVAESALEQVQGVRTSPEQPERPWWQFWRS